MNRNLSLVTTYLPVAGPLFELQGQSCNRFADRCKVKQGRASESRITTKVAQARRIADVPLVPKSGLFPIYPRSPIVRRQMIVHVVSTAVAVIRRSKRQNLLGSAYGMTNTIRAVGVRNSSDIDTAEWFEWSDH